MTQIKELQAELDRIDKLYKNIELKIGELEDMEIIDEMLSQMWEKCRADCIRLLQGHEVDFSQLDQFVETSLQSPSLPFPEIGFLDPCDRHLKCFSSVVTELKTLCARYLSNRFQTEVLPLLEQVQVHLGLILAIEDRYGQHRVKDGVKSENLTDQLVGMMPAFEEMCSSIRGDKFVEFQKATKIFLRQYQELIGSYDETYPVLTESQPAVLDAYERARSLYQDLFSKQLPALKNVLSPFDMDSMSKIEEDLYKQQEYIERCRHMERLIERKAEIVAEIRSLELQQVGRSASCLRASLFGENRQTVSASSRFAK